MERVQSAPMQNEITLHGVGKITVNLHRLRGNEIGYEASTRFLKNDKGRYYVSSGETEAEALNDLAHEIGVSMARLTVINIG